MTTLRLATRWRCGAVSISDDKSTPASAPEQWPFLKRIPGAANNNAIPLNFIRLIGQTRLLLTVPEHACLSRYSRCGGFIIWIYMSEGDVDAKEALKIPCLYRVLRSDAKTRLCQWRLLQAWNLLIMLLATCSLGTSVIP